MSIASLSIDITAKLANLERDMGKAAHIATQNAAKMSAAFKAAGTVFNTMFAGLSVAGLTSFIKSNVDAMDALNDVADATGSTIEMLSGLENVAKRNGGTLDDVAGILVKFNGALKEADGKNGVSLALKAIGTSAEELRKLDPAEALQRVAVGLSSFADNGNKARIVQELFGKSIREAAPFLKDLAEAGSINATVTTAQAQAAETFNKQLGALKTEADNAARSLVSELIPALTEYLRIVQRAKGFGPETLVNEVKANLANANLESIVSQIEQFTEASRKEPYNRAYKERLVELREEYARVSKSALDASEKIKSLANQAKPLAKDAGGGRGFINPEVLKPSLPVIPAKPEKISEAADQYDNLIQRIKEKLKAEKEEASLNRELTAAERERLSLLGALEGITKADTEGKRAGIKASIEQLYAAQKLNDERKEQKRVAEQLNSARDAEIESGMQQMQAWQESTKTLREQVQEIGKTAEQIERLRLARLEEALAVKEDALAVLQMVDAESDAVRIRKEEIDQLREQLSLQRQAVDEMNRMRTDPMAGALSGLDDYMTRVRRAGDTTKSAVEEALSSLENTMTDFFSKGKAGWGDFIQSIMSQILRLTIVQPMINSIVGALGAYIGGASNTGATGYSKGAPVRLATGTNYVPYDGMPAILHEGEAVVPKKYNPAAGGAGGATVVQNINFGDNVDPASMGKFAKSIAASVKAEIFNSQRRGGAFAQ